HPLLRFHAAQTLQILSRLGPCFCKGSAEAAMIPHSREARVMIRTIIAAFSRQSFQKRRNNRSIQSGSAKRRRSMLMVERLEDRSLLAAVPATAYLQTNLISDQPGVASITDPSLANAWGLAVPPTGGNFWISDNG